MQARTLWRRLTAALVVGLAAAGAVAQNNQSLGETDIRTIFADKPFIRDMVIPEDMVVSQFPGVSGGGLARNTTGATIAADRVVYVSGTAVDPTSGVTLPLITLATQESGDATADERTRGLYVTVESIATATNGRIALRALSTTAPIDLAAGTQGDPIYLGLTGLPTRTQPTGASMSQEVGTIAVVATDVIAWNLAASENEVHTHIDQSQGGQIALSAAGTAASISADAAGRALFADNFFTTAQLAAGAGGKFTTDLATAAVWRNLGAAGSFDNATIAELVADDAFTATEFGAGAGGKFAANALVNAGIVNLFGDDSWTATEFGAGAGGKFAPNALANAGIANLFADDSWTTVEFGAGAGGKFAAGALNNAGIVNLVADDGFTATEFGAGAGGKFAANALVQAGIANLFADDSWTATEFAAGAGGKFAVDAISTAAAWQNLGGANTWTTPVIAELVIDDAFTTVEFGAGAGGKFAAGALNTAGIANLVADDGFSAVEVSTAGAGGKFAANALTTAGIANLVADDAFSAVEVSTAGAGGKFAAGALTTAGIQNLVADDAFTTAEFAALAGGKFAAGALNNAGLANLIADDAFTATEVSTAGANGKFAANSLTAAGVTNMIAADAFTAANNLQVFQDGSFAADAATRALFGAGIWTAAELATSSVATAEILDATVAPIDLLTGTSTLDANVDTPIACVSRTFNSASDAAQDVTIYSASSPAMEILDVWLDPDVAEGGALTVTLRDAAGGLGNAISSALNCNVTTVERTTAITSNSLAANSSLVMRFSAAVGAAGGTLHVEYRRR